MRLHISLDDDLVAELDRVAGPRGRSAFVTESVVRALDTARRIQALEDACGSISDTGHEWDDDPVAWVAAQRRIDPNRVG